MEDPEVVAAIVAGDPAGLAEAYDRYAMPLYSTSLVALNGQLTVNPGSRAITVVLSISL
jgi:hypothetical protein